VDNLAASFRGNVQSLYCKAARNSQYDNRFFHQKASEKSWIMNNKIEIRHLQELDLPFIFSSWLRSYKEESAFAKRIKNEVFYFWHHRIIEVTLAKPSVRVLVASDKDEPTVIYGYIVTEVINSEPKIIHYCFVKEHFRQMGIAKLLFKESGIQGNFFISHFTYSAEPIVNKREEITYDPYRII
jgi:hypothetical protein